MGYTSTDIPPPFFTLEEYHTVDDLRGFRHLFRNLYTRTIDPHKVLLVQKKVPAAITAFNAGRERYIRFLQTLCSSLEDSNAQ